MIPLNETTIREQMSSTVVPAQARIHRDGGSDRLLRMDSCLRGDDKIEIPMHFHLLSSIDSTNRFLKERPPSNAIEICCAEEQTEGRGRFGRHWHSPFGKNIYCSIRLKINADMPQLSGLGLVVSMAVCAALETIPSPHPVLIKWPNDLMWCHQKLSGNLIEVVSTNPGHYTDLVIGIGLNVNDTAHDEPLINKPWCSVFDITGQKYDRNILIAALIIQVKQHLQQLIKQGFSSFLPTWRPLDYLLNQYITVSQPLNLFRGRAKGVNNEGYLILIDDHGVMHYLSSGDTSVDAAG